MCDTQCLPTLESLLHHVHQVLCLRDHLDPCQAPLSHELILRRGKPCGLFLQVQGPRLLKNYAIWAGDENRILLYDATGERYGEIQLSESCRTRWACRRDVRRSIVIPLAASKGSCRETHDACWVDVNLTCVTPLAVTARAGATG